MEFTERTPFNIDPGRANDHDITFVHVVLLGSEHLLICRVNGEKTLRGSVRCHIYGCRLNL
jgi:hypothetical protein